jgi:hypothetical protein
VTILSIWKKSSKEIIVFYENYYLNIFISVSQKSVNCLFHKIITAFKKIIIMQKFKNDNFNQITMPLIYESAVSEEYNFIAKSFVFKNITANQEFKDCSIIPLRIKFADTMYDKDKVYFKTSYNVHPHYLLMDKGKVITRLHLGKIKDNKLDIIHKVITKLHLGKIRDNKLCITLIMSPSNIANLIFPTLSGGCKGYSPISMGDVLGLSLPHSNDYDANLTDLIERAEKFSKNENYTPVLLHFIHKSDFYYSLILEKDGIEDTIIPNLYYKNNQPCSMDDFVKNFEL